jgi:hypothetical protein
MDRGGWQPVNVLEVEKAVAAYIRGLAAVPAATQVREAVATDDMDFEKQAVVVELTDSEARGKNLFLCTLQVSLRSPSMAIARTTHSSLFASLSTALQHQVNFTTAFNASATGLTFGGSYLTSVPGPDFTDRAWINSLQLALGVRVV